MGSLLSASPSLPYQIYEFPSQNSTTLKKKLLLLLRVKFGTSKFPLNPLLVEANTKSSIGQEIFSGS